MDIDNISSSYIPPAITIEEKVSEPSEVEVKEQASEDIGSRVDILA